MPVINGSRGYVAYIAACFLGTLKAAFILLQSVCLTQRAGNKAGSDVVSPRLVCVYLFEKIEIALITAFKSLICLFAAKYLDCTLTNASVHTRGDELRARSGEDVLPADRNSLSPEANSNARPGQAPSAN